MTVEVARRTRRRATKASVTEPPIPQLAAVAIGEIGQTIFECPSCSRPLALGARRCPGCGTRLIGGVTLGKASGFVAVGLAAGLLVGGGGGLFFGSQSATRAPAALAAAPSLAPVTGSNGGGGRTTAPTATASTTARPATAPPDPGIPPLARTALVQVVATNARLAVEKAELRAALAAPVLDASAIAQTLRTLSADSLFGEQLADHVGGWSGSAAVGAELATFYGSIHETAANGLAASVRNSAAYRAAAIAMVRLLDRMPAIDAAVRSTAESAGIDLPAASGAPVAP